MGKIWKQPIVLNSLRGEPNPIRILARSGSVPLSVGLQNGVLCCWFKVNEDLDESVLTIYSVGTGYGRVPDGAKFINSVVDGNYTWHFFYTTPAV